MKKNFTVNICGSIFNIDEDAFEKLNHYLEAIKKHFRTSEGGDEIISDIESRIGEMLRETLSEEKQVITIDDIDKVVQVMGQPFEFESEEGKPEQDDLHYDEKKRPKRLFRDGENRIIGGVAAGMGAYFNADPLWFRLGFIASIFFVGPLLYIIFWIIMPLARSTSDKLEMRGQKVNISNIKRSINEEISALKDKLEDLKGETRETFQKKNVDQKNIFDQILEFIITIFKYTVKAVVVLLGIALIALGIFIAIGFFVSVLESNSLMHVSPIGISKVSVMMFLKSIFSSNNTMILAVTGIILVIGIPILMLIYAGFRMIFNFNFKSRIVGIPALSLWIAGLLICIVVSIHLTRSFNQRFISKEDFTLQQPAGNTMYISLKDKHGKEEMLEFGHNIMFGKCNVLALNNNFIGIPELKIIKNDTDSFELRIYKSSKGIDHKSAKQTAERIYYNFSQKDSILILDPYFTMPEGELWRSQRIKIMIKVPEGKKVKLNEEATMFFDYNFNNEYIYQSSYNNMELSEDKREVIIEKGAYPMEKTSKFHTISGIHLTSCPINFF